MHFHGISASGVYVHTHRVAKLELATLPFLQERGMSGVLIQLNHNAIASQRCVDYQKPDGNDDIGQNKNKEETPSGGMYNISRQENREGPRMCKNPQNPIIQPTRTLISPSTSLRPFLAGRSGRDHPRPSNLQIMIVEIDNTILLLSNLASLFWGSKTRSSGGGSRNSMSAIELGERFSFLGCPTNICDICFVMRDLGEPDNHSHNLE
jgi:hypothetical protein